MYEYLDQGKRRLAIELERLRLRIGDAQPLQTARAVESLDTSPSILFLCYGNICRSPMAERYAATKLDEMGQDDVTVNSAGFHSREGRSSPPNAVSAAREYDVELDTHRSKSVTPELFAESDLVVLMDAYNYYQLRTEFPAVEPKTYFLKAFAETADGFEVPDPYDGDVAEFRRVYDDVTSGIEGLLSALDWVNG